MAYHYRESGLENIWLENGYVVHETPYGSGVSIEDTQGLHRAISQCLIDIPKRLNGSELRFLRLELELTQKDLAGILGVEEQALRRWEKNRSKFINGSADRLLRAIVKEYLHGDGSLRAMIDRLAELNTIELSSITFIETEKGWQSDRIAA